MGVFQIRHVRLSVSNTEKIELDLRWGWFGPYAYAGKKGEVEGMKQRKVFTDSEVAGSACSVFLFITEMAGVRNAEWLIVTAPSYFNACPCAPQTPPYNGESPKYSHVRSGASQLVWTAGFSNEGDMFPPWLQSQLKAVYCSKGTVGVNKGESVKPWADWGEWCGGKNPGVCKQNETKAEKSHGTHMGLHALMLSLKFTIP